MKIINVTPGLIPIPPNGWGAVEKILWEIHQNLLKLGHDSKILYLNEISDTEAVVHIHVANLALLAQERGIPYYFTLHDHHAVLNGKNSRTYKENLQAMKGAIKSFVPAKYLIDYFEGIPEYSSHGVNTNYFVPGKRTINHKLLCVANNGYAHNPTIDRKGFGIAIEAARQLNLPITIVGPSNNKNYFEKYPSDYDGLTIKYDVSEKELLTIYQEHSIFLHPSELEAGHPNLTLLEALSCGLPIVGTFEPHNSLEGMIVTKRTVDDTVAGINKILGDYHNYTILARNQAEKLDWMNRTKELLTKYDTEPLTMREELLKHYNNTEKLHKTIPFRLNYHCIDGMFAEILGGPDHVYDVSFVRQDDNTKIFNVELQKNTWGKTNIKYYVNWKVVIHNKTTGEVTEFPLELKGKRVLICMESKSLGDTLAWLPYVEEFRKLHDCEMICVTFWNHLFTKEYPHITFTEPGTVVDNLIALYRIGLFYKENEVDYDRHPSHPIHVPLQKVATDILGLPYKEVRPLITQPTVDNTNSKQVCIAIHSTAQAKYWNNPSGWQEIVDWLTNKGYTVRLLSQEGDGYMGNNNPRGVVQHPSGPIESVIIELLKSNLFIGLGSGLSWLSWGLNIPTVLISGFSYKWAEMQDCIRIGAPKGKCEGCFNRHQLNPGDWNWCPDHKGTSRQFECTREITADMVIQELEKIL